MFVPRHLCPPAYQYAVFFIDWMEVIHAAIHFHVCVRVCEYTCACTIISACSRTLALMRMHLRLYICAQIQAQVHKHACVPESTTSAGTYTHTPHTQTCKCAKIHNFCRHGESHGNVEKSTYCTQPDHTVGLTAKGRQQAIATGQHLRRMLVRCLRCLLWWEELIGLFVPVRAQGGMLRVYIAGRGLADCLPAAKSKRAEQMGTRWNVMSACIFCRRLPRTAATSTCSS